jgi:hypothetical protein
MLFDLATTPLMALLKSGAIAAIVNLFENVDVLDWLWKKTVECLREKECVIGYM